MSTGSTVPDFPYFINSEDAQDMLPLSIAKHLLRTKEIKREW